MKIKCASTIILDTSPGVHISVMALEALLLEQETDRTTVFKHNGKLYRARLHWDEVDSNGIKLTEKEAR